MTDILDRLSKLSQKQLMLLALDQQEEIDAAKASAHAPIAIVGMSCRFPGGADSPEAFWELLRAGRDAVGEVPAERWDVSAYFDPDPETPARMSTRQGGFLSSVDGFDAGLFGISPREALAMDPQQRLLLETAWEALERGGFAPERLAGSATGVFVGLCNSDHFQRALKRGIDNIDAYIASGNAPSVASGRISYCLGLQGPALTVDTACSSSLVALHLACRSLRSGETSLALACGVNLMCAPEMTIALTKSHMLSPDGRCKSFDASADGFGRGEGCGVLVLKRLDDALADHDDVLAVIHGTAANQDGRSGGLTVPNGPAQEAVVRAALADAGAGPADISYVEAHGTGTTLGDPIEVRALAAVLGAGRTQADPLPFGSVKANIGHLESAAGIASVIKLVLSLNNERIPPQVHFKEPSPHIAWANYPLRVLADGQAWPKGDVPRLAGVSSFGFSGTNAHAIIGDAPLRDDDEPLPAALPGFRAVPLSARSGTALSRLAGLQAEALAASPGVALSEVARTLGAGRSHFAERIAVVAEDVETVRAAFAARAAGQPHPALRAGTVLPGETPEVAFAFGSELAPAAGAVAALSTRYPVFAQAIARCEAWLGRSLADGLAGQGAADPALTEPALFALHYATAELWRSFDIQPAAVAGSGTGDIAAAVVAGVMSAEDGLRLAAERGRLLATEAAPGLATVGGAPSFGGHGSAGGLEAFAGRIAMLPPRIPVAWSRTGGSGPTADAAPDARYFGRHLTQSEPLAESVGRLAADGYKLFLEMAPQTAAAPSGTLLRSFGDGGDTAELARSLAELYVRGGAIDWRAVEGAGPRLRLPSYSFEHQSYWLDPRPPAVAVAAPTRSGDPLLGSRLPTATPIFETVLAPTAPAYLADHLVRGQVHVAGSVLLDLVLRNAALAFGGARHAVEGFLIEESLVLPAEGRAVQVHFGEQGHDGAASFAIYSRAPGGEGTGERPWSRHAKGRLIESAASPRARSATPLPELIATLGPAESCAPHYQRLSQLGIELGASCRFLVDSRSGTNEVLVRVQDIAGLDAGAKPALIDAAFQVIGLAVPKGEGEGMYLLTEVERIELGGPLPAGFWCHARIRDTGQKQPAQLLADVTLRGDDGVVLGELRGIILRRSVGRSRAPVIDDLFYTVEWPELPAPERTAPALSGPSGFIEAVRGQFKSFGATHGLSVYDRLLPALDTLSADHIGAALRSLGFDATPGRSFTADAEGATLGVIARHGKLFGRLLDILVAEGALAREGDGFRVVGPLPSGDPAARYDELFATFAPVLGELSTLRRCGFKLGEVLTGAQDPLQLLFPGGSLAEARTLYVESPSARTYNGALAEALRAALKGVPADRPLRVLEVGAGTGGTTGYVLSVLKGRAVEYNFTDVSPLFLEQAREIFADAPFLQTALLDIERNPLEQGFEAGRYDVVVAANVLHATADMAKTMRHVRTLMADGGLALLLEGVTPEPWVDLTFGLTEGWWRFTDAELRPDYPLIDVPAWRGLLHAQGFSDIVALPEVAPDTRAGAQQALLFARADASFRHWTLVGDRDGLGAALAAKLTARGYRVAQRDASAPVTVEEGELIYLGALELSQRPASDIDTAPACEALSFAQPLRWLSEAAASSRSWLVTRGAEPVAGAQAPGARWQAPLWGLGRVFALEKPDRWGGLIDLPPEGSAEALADLVITAVEAGDGEDQAAYRNGVRHVARLTRTAAPTVAPIKLRADGTYLVTGGFGGLGLLVARWLAESGAGRIALLSRKPDETLPALAEIRALGVSVTCHAGDVSNEASMRAVFAALDAEGPPLRGILHAAAAFSAGAVGDLTAEQIRSMMRPKIDGALVLEKLAAGRPLDLFVLFSTTTALIGAAGFAHYAGANMFLDATAKGSPTPGVPVSVNWGTWEEMRLADAESRRFYRESGLEPMPGRDALDALGRILAAPMPQAVVARINWQVLKPVHEARRRRPFLAAIETRSATTAATEQRDAAVPVSGLAEQLAAIPPSGRNEFLTEFVRRAVAETLGGDPNESISPHIGLFEMGMDSLMSVELKRRLEQGAGRSLPSTLTFNYPNIGALATYLGKTLVVAEAAPAAAAKEVEATPTPATSTAAVSTDLDTLSTEDLQARLMARLKLFDAS
ncbi:MAG TPA: type I polyketide synthase [Xanthobacteraceae bacterium]|nr:type I polyketide synthase [Xanthobacteraceae bacterium]